MSWVRLDDDFATHPKVLGISARALRLHIYGLLYCARYETDGHVPRHALPSLAGTAALAAELTTRQLWHNNDTGWLIHDYLQYNPSAKELQRRRKDAKKRMSKARSGR